MSVESLWHISFSILAVVCFIYSAFCLWQFKSFNQLRPHGWTLGIYNTAKTMLWVGLLAEVVNLVGFYVDEAQIVGIALIIVVLFLTQRFNRMCKDRATVDDELAKRMAKPSAFMLIGLSWAFLAERFLSLSIFGKLALGIAH